MDEHVQDDKHWDAMPLRITVACDVPLDATVVRGREAAAGLSTLWQLCAK